MQDAVLVGRQGIYDAAQRVFGYELLFRDSERGGAIFADGDRASSRVLLNAFLEIGIDNVVGPHCAFVNMTRDLLLDPAALPLTTDRVVLELLEDAVVDDELVDAVASIKRSGYRLALDDYAFEDKWAPLVPYADIIKVDVPRLDWRDAPARLAELRRPGTALLAEKVETQEEFDRLRRLGFDLFQGYFFERPRIVSATRLDENRLVVLRLLARINDPETGIDELKSLIEQDPVLSFKILRYINSASVGLRRRVDSLQQAVVYMGLARIRAWASLAAMSGVIGKPDDLFHVALLRAHFCRSLVEDRAATAFTVGILSILDRVMDRPAGELLADLPLSAEIREAIVGHRGDIGRALACVQAIELRDWQALRETRLPVRTITGLFAEASRDAWEAQHALDPRQAPP